MNVLIYQPVGLGDILWLQPIVDTYLNQNYEVWYPVEDIYRDLLIQYLPKDGLHWVSPEDNFPMKDRYGHIDRAQDGDNLYLPLSHADKHIPQASVMMSKYYFAQHPLVDWHPHINIKRDLDREARLMDHYRLNGGFMLVNRNFGTFPHYATRKFTINQIEGIKQHTLSIEQDRSNGFHIFDWIGAIANASIIHTVETSFSYLVDKYSVGEIHMYEKRQEHQPNNHYYNVNMVYKNSNWIYHA